MRLRCTHHTRRTSITWSQRRTRDCARTRHNLPRHRTRTRTTRRRQCKVRTKRCRRRSHRQGGLRNTCNRDGCINRGNCVVVGVLRLRCTHHTRRTSITWSQRRTRDCARTRHNLPRHRTRTRATRRRQRKVRTKRCRRRSHRQRGLRNTANRESAIRPCERITVCICAAICNSWDDRVRTTHCWLCTGRPISSSVICRSRIGIGDGHSVRTNES